MPMPHFFSPMSAAAELIFTIFAVIFCFLIYFKTKETYELTKYKGIKYFRNAFLFFGLSYASRLLLGLLFLSREAFEFIIPKEMFILLLIVPVGYFSTIGIFYLIFSSVWKKFNNTLLLVVGHAAAVLLTVISFATHSHMMVLYLQIILLAAAVFLGFKIYPKGKKISEIKILYLLVAVLWLISLFILDRRAPFPLEIKIFFQLISLAVFITIYYKISKWML